MMIYFAHLIYLILLLGLMSKVWHDGLSFKLEQKCVLPKLLTNYLVKRKQCVVLNGLSSEWKEIEFGVPQGSIFGPLLFLISIDDLENDIISQVKFFADDTMIFSIVHDPISSAAELNRDLQLISDWAYQWKMAFNHDPNKQAVELVFSQKKMGQIHPHIYFDNVEVKKSRNHQHLGLVLDSKLAFVTQINQKIITAKKGIRIIKYISQFPPVKTLDQIYKMSVRPHLDYCDVIYHIPPLNNRFDSSIRLNPLMESLEQIQYQAALSITGYEELGRETMSDRRWARRLTYVFKIFRNESPPYLKERVPQ